MSVSAPAPVLVITPPPEMAPESVEATELLWLRFAPASMKMVPELFLYLFKLRQTTKVRAQIERLERTAEAWSHAGDGWQGAEAPLKLMGWTRARRCIFLRRPAERTPSRPALPASTEFDFVQVLDHGPCYEYIVLVTNTELELSAVAQAYRDRADCENVFDEIKNQWGWGGFVTQDLRRCRIMARLIALVCKRF